MKFHPTLQRITLWMPIAFLIPIFAELLSPHALPDDLMSHLKPYMNFILLDALHLAFTFTILLLYSDLRQYLHKKYTVALSSLTLIGAATLVWIFVLVIRDTQLIAQSQTWIWPEILIGAVLIPLILNHTIKQSYGLEFNFSSHRPRRSLINGLLLFAILPGWLSLCEKYSSLNYPVVFAIIKAGCVSIGLAIALHLIYKQYLMTKRWSDTSVIYSLRYLLFPLSTYSTLAIIGVIGFHGFEYLMLFETYLRKANNFVSSFKKWTFLALPLGFVTAYSAFNLISQVQSYSAGGVSKSLTLSLFGAIVGGISFCHCLLDGIMYKFGQPQLAEIHSKILSSDSKKVG